MKKALISLGFAFLLASCTVDKTGLSAESSRLPEGNPDALAVLEEFGDLQCPACKAAESAIIQPILEEYGDRIRFEFNHFPLRAIHPYALEAAEASECAADQGAFWDYHDVIYNEQEKLNSDQLVKWAQDLGLDEDLFMRCLKSGIKRKTILEDFQEGRDRGVSGTPTFFVNGEQVPSNLEAIKAAIDAQLGSDNIPL